MLVIGFIPFSSCTASQSMVVLSVCGLILWMFPCPLSSTVRVSVAGWTAAPTEGHHPKPPALPCPAAGGVGGCVPSSVLGLPAGLRLSFDSVLTGFTVHGLVGEQPPQWGAGHCQSQVHFSAACGPRGCAVHRSSSFPSVLNSQSYGVCFINLS